MNALDHVVPCVWKADNRGEKSVDVARWVAGGGSEPGRHFFYKKLYTGSLPGKGLSSVCMVYLRLPPWTRSLRKSQEDKTIFIAPAARDLILSCTPTVGGPTTSDPSTDITDQAQDKVFGEVIDGVECCESHCVSSRVLTALLSFSSSISHRAHQTLNITARCTSRCRPAAAGRS